MKVFGLFSAGLQKNVPPGQDIHLRDDGRTWDLGYTRTVQRLDDKLVTIYYYTTEKNEEQHIAATIWDPDKVE